MKSRSRSARIAAQLADLKMPGALEALDEVLAGVDEIGYLPVTRSGAIPFFQLVNRRYEHASTVVTSNKGFEQ